MNGGKILKQQRTRSILIGFTCIILAVCITVQFRTMKKQDSSVSQSIQNDELKNKFFKAREEYSQITEELERSNKQLETLRTASTQNDSDSKSKTEELKRNQMLLGLTDVTGEGVVVTVQDGQAPKNADNLSDYLVHDGDLREIVNELANSGAEAISINDERIVSTTCINCVGSVISINGEKVGSPFVIKAIGNRASLYGGINRPGNYIEVYMKDYTNVDVKKSNSITIKKYSGAIKFKYAETVTK